MARKTLIECDFCNYVCDEHGKYRRISLCDGVTIINEWWLCPNCADTLREKFDNAVLQMREDHGRESTL